MLSVRPFTRLTKVIYFSDKVFLYVSITTAKTYFIFLFYLYLFCLFILKRVTACTGRVRIAKKNFGRIPDVYCVMCIVCASFKFAILHLCLGS